MPFPSGRYNPRRYRRLLTQRFLPRECLPPTGCVVWRKDAELRVTWSAPDSEGQIINFYEVAYSTDGGSNWTVASATVASNLREYTITGLTNGTTYLCSVRALTWKEGQRGLTGSVAPAAAPTYSTTGSPVAGTFEDSSSGGVGYYKSVVRFTGAGTLTMTSNPASTTMTSTVIGGGGAGGSTSGSYGSGGGGAGDFNPATIASGDVIDTFTVVIGAGGGSASSGTTTPTDASDSTVTASATGTVLYGYKGGYGGTGSGNSGQPPTGTANFGSGGGSLINQNYGYAGTNSVNAFRGGEAAQNWSYGARAGGGGGGSNIEGYNGTVGAQSTWSSTGGYGGSGKMLSHSNGSGGKTNVYIAGGGGGGGMQNSGVMYAGSGYGQYGGGNGKLNKYYDYTTNVAGDGGTNSGAGGGGAAFANPSGNGGSGLVHFEWDI